MPCNDGDDARKPKCQSQRCINIKFSALVHMKSSLTLLFKPSSINMQRHFMEFNSPEFVLTKLHWQHSNPRSLDLSKHSNTAIVRNLKEFTNPIYLFQLIVTKSNEITAYLVAVIMMLSFTIDCHAKFYPFFLWLQKHHERNAPGQSWWGYPSPWLMSIAHYISWVSCNDIIWFSTHC